MYINTTQPKCSVNITTSRNRVKHYDGKVYLKDGQKFEIELFNPHSIKMLAKIKMNGHYISDSGLVINPGQRVYLERYLDSNNAFLFSTYEVDGTVEALKAIAENGNIEVEFYSESLPSGTFITSTFDWTYRPNQIMYDSGMPTQNIYYSSHDVIGQNTSITNASFFSQALNEETKGSIETGRVEKGGSTKQEFSTSNDSFYSWASETTTIKLLPLSAKPTEVKEIRNYCTGCGTRMKKSTWKFCPNCGTKI
jgi:hypothetical protein